MNPQTHTGPRLLAADQLKLAAVVTAPACARLFVRQVCEQWMIPDEQADIAELLASELVTNVVEATGILGANPDYPVVHALARLIGIGALRFERTLVLEVCDTKLDPPLLLEPDGEVEHGRGLQLVDSLSLRWGYYYVRVGGKVVWCELALAPEPERPDAPARARRTAGPDLGYAVMILPALPFRRLAGRRPNPSRGGIQHYRKGPDVNGFQSSWRTRAVNLDKRTQLRAGVVGIGKQAIEDHIPGLLASDGARVVAICDDDPEVVREQQYRQRVPGYTDFREMFKAEQLDLVVVTTPHHVGRDVIYAAAEHRIHVLKEKPFATSMEEAKELADICDQSGIQLMVTLQRRFNPIYTSFLQLADQIGTPFVVDAEYTLHIPDPSEGWRGTTAKAGGGCVIDMGYHLIDMILWYFGQPDRILADLSVSARPDRDYDAEDTGLIHFAYDSGLYGSLLVSRFIGPKREQIRLVGSKGIVQLERGRVQRLTNDGEVIESLSREQAWPSAAACQVDYFCRVIDQLRPNLSGPAENLAHMSFIAASYESARTHAYVNPKELLA